MFLQLKHYLKSNILSIMLLISLAACGFTLKQINFQTENKTILNDTKSLNTALQFQNTLRSIAKSLSPSIVNIQVVQKAAKQSPFSMQGDALNDFLRRFFGRDFNFDQGPSQKEEKPSALGSGFIISEDGYIITNTHVIQNADTITVQTSDHHTFKAELIGSDKKTDIALIKIASSGHPLTVAPLGNSDTIEPGDFAIALGNPFGLNRTMTFGIISAKGRNDYIEQNAPYKNYIQSDVPVNPGNSGGPLINIKGQVIGINSAIYSTSGGSIGISFAIPINIAKNVIQQLSGTGKVTRGSIGVLINPLDEDIAQYNHLDSLSGVVINDVIPGQPAAKAGIKPGDIAIKIDGKKIQDAGDFVSKISSLAPSTTIKLTVVRNKKPMTLSIKLGSQDSINKDNKKSKKDSKVSNVLNWNGISLMSSLQARKQGYNIQEDGIVVTSVKSNSKAFSKGLRPGMFVQSVNNIPIRSITQLNNIIKNKKGLLFQFSIPNQSGNLFIVLP